MVEAVFKVVNQSVNEGLQCAHPPLAVLMANLDIHPELRCKASIVEMGRFTLIELMSTEANGGTHPEARGRYSGWYLVDTDGHEAELYHVDDMVMVLRRVLEHESGCGDPYEVVPQSFIDDVELRFIGGSKASVGVVAAHFRLALRSKLEECGWCEPREEPTVSTLSRSVTSSDVGLVTPSTEPVKYAGREDIEKAYDNASAKHCPGDCPRGEECSACNADNYTIMGGVVLLTIPVKSIHEATAADLICLVNGYYADQPLSKVVNKPEVTYVYCKLHTCFYAMPPMPEGEHWVEYTLEQWRLGAKVPVALQQQLKLSDLIG